MSPKPIVSVVIPIYKVEKYLHQCVDSVLAQTYTDIEIILVNDGSPDECPLICDQYALKDTRIKVIHKANGGSSAARNSGIESSIGDYIFFLDGDDYIAPDCILSLVKAAENGALSIIGYALDLTDENHIAEPVQAFGHYASLRDYLLLFHKLFATKFNFAWGKLYSALIIKHNKIRFPEGVSLGEDLLFNLQYYRFCSGGLEAIPYIGYYYRQHGSVTLSKKFHPDMFRWNELCYTSIRDYLTEYDCFTDKNRVYLYRNIAGNYLYSFHLIANNPMMTTDEKAALIRKFSVTPIYKDSLEVKQNTRFDYRLFQYLLSKGFVLPYIYLEHLKNKLTHGRN